MTFREQINAYFDANKGEVIDITTRHTYGRCRRCQREWVISSHAPLHRCPGCDPRMARHPRSVTEGDFWSGAYEVYIRGVRCKLAKPRHTSYWRTA